MEARLISTVVSRNSPSLQAGFHMQMNKKILRIAIRPMQIPRKKAKRDAETETGHTNQELPMPNPSGAAGSERKY